MVDLRQDCERVERAWNDSQELSVPLSMAAALTFHQTHRKDQKLLYEREYADALDIAAAALSCLVPIYTLNADGGQSRLVVNLARQRFGGGAVRIQNDDGAVIAPLAIVRSQVLPALLAIGRSGIEYLAPRRT